MADLDRLEQGRAVIRRLYGDKRAQALEDGMAALFPGFLELVMSNVMIYDRPGLDLRTRSAITIGVSTALGRYTELAVWIRAGLHVGLTEDEIREVLLQVSPYAGVPVVAEAFVVANKVLEKAKREKIAQD